MYIIAAGGTKAPNGENFGDMCARHSVNKLYSALTEKRYIDKYDHDMWLMVDSGAHVWNKKTINKVGMKRTTPLPDIYEHADGYIEYIDKNKDKPHVFVELDCYAVLPKDYIDEMYKKVSDIDGNFEFMRVYHPAIDGGSLDEFKKWVDEGQTYIGIGNDSRPYLNEIFNIARDKVKIHGFAMIDSRLLLKYPFYSVDSTKALVTIIYGGVCTGMLSVKTQKDKFKLVLQKDIRVIDDNTERLERALADQKESQDFYTKMWDKRGIIWE